MNISALWIKTAYVAALFIVGAATGTVISVSVTKEMHSRPPRPHDMSQQMMKDLRDRLDLTPEQLQKADPVMEKTAAELKVIYDESRRKAGSVMDASYAQIAALLTPEQKVKLEQLQSEHHHFPGPPPPGGPPGGPHEPHRHWRPPGPGPGDNNKPPRPDMDRDRDKKLRPDFNPPPPAEPKQPEVPQA